MLTHPNVKARIADLEAENAALRRQVQELGEQLEFDRTAVAASMTAANKAVDGRHWLTEGRGPYEWDDDRWHGEFYAAALEIKAALEPLTKIAANWAGCPMKADEVAAARIDWKQRAEAAEAKVQEQAAEIAQAKDALLGECYPVSSEPGDIADGIRSTGAGWKLAELREDEQRKRAEAAEQRAAELAGKLAEAQKDTELWDRAEMLEFVVRPGLTAMGRKWVINLWTGTEGVERIGARLKEAVREAIDAALKSQEPQEKQP
jgi:hypothetical protein